MIQIGYEALETSTDGLVNYKRLKEIRGFLGQSMTYCTDTSYYLTGLHLTLASSYHPGRDKFGWKMAFLQEAVESGKLSSNKANYMAEAAIEPTGPELVGGQEIYNQEN